MAYQDYRFSSLVQHLHPGKELVQMSPVLPGSGFVQQNNTRFHDSMKATASLCLWPRLSEYGSIDEVLLNIKMRAQIKGIISEAGRTRPELVDGDVVGQANIMFWLIMNELQFDTIFHH